MALDVQVPAPRRPGDGRAPALCGLLRAGEVIADLTATTFCDSSGIAALLRASREAEILGRDLRLAVRPAGAVSRVLELTGPVPGLRLFGSVREAAGGRR
jgi:anti-sigma B factor antagonist